MVRLLPQILLSMQQRTILLDLRSYLSVVIFELHVCHNHLSLVVILRLKLLPLDVEACQSDHLMGSLHGDSQMLVLLLLFSTCRNRLVPLLLMGSTRTNTLLVLL